MGNIVIVRHGQANFHGDHYDQLSSLGEAQALALGQFWATQGRRWDRIIVGPKQRHRQTLAAVERAYGAQGLSLGEPEVMAGFDEHHGAEVVRAAIGTRGQPQTGDKVRDYFKAYQVITKEWVFGTHHDPNFESWVAFRQRVVACLLQIKKSAANTVIFSSGGPVAVCSGQALGCDDLGMLALSWVVRNGAFSELLFSTDRLSLLSFNELGHLTQTPDHTFI